MRARVLAFVAMLGLVLAPILPSQRIYLCTMDGQIHASCCCHAEGATADSDDISGCCKIITVHQFMAPGHDSAPLVCADQTGLVLDLPVAPLVGLLTWYEPRRGARHLDPPPPPPLAWFIRTGALLT